MAGDPVSVRDLTNEELLDWIPLQSTSRLIEEGESELRRRLQAGEEAKRKLAEVERKAEAYDAARATVKREGLSRAEYVLRAEEAERERDRLASEYQSYREASNLEGARDAAEIARLTEQVAEPWTDAVLVEKVARGLYELAMAPDPYPFSWDDATTPREAWRDEARRVLGESS